MFKILITFMLCAFSHANAESCAARRPLSDSDMTPSGLQAWVNENAQTVTSPGDLVCCLPEQYKKNYAIGHSSLAAQPGTPEHPRALLFEDVAQFDFHMILTVSSADHEHRGDNVEIVYQDPNSGINSFFDLEFGRAKPQLEKNPPLCLACHGNQHGELGIGGPHLNFDITSNWPRFVGGVERCTAQGDELQMIAGKRAVRTILEQSTYRCLDKGRLSGLKAPIANEDEFIEKVSDLRSRLFNLDFKLNRQNSRRIAMILAAQKDYETFKYALIAKSMCDFGENALEELVPEDVLARLLKKANLLSGLSEARDLNREFEDRFADLLQKASLTQWRSPTQTEAEIFHDGLTLPTGSALMCENGLEFQHASFGALRNSSDLHQRLYIDSFFKEKQNGLVVDDLLKLFLEGEGNSISGLSMSFFYDDLTSALSLNREVGRRLLRLENDHSEIRHLLPDTLIEHELSNETCENLKRLSRARFKSGVRITSGPASKAIHFLDLKCS